MNFRKRITYLTIAILAVLGGGTVGFYGLSRTCGSTPSLVDCLYQTVITLATVGSREMQPLSSVWYGELFIIFLLLTGIGILGMFATTITAFLVEGEIRNVFRRRKMDKTLSRLRDHYIVCGAGETGHHAIRELIKTHHAVVVVDASEEHIHRIIEAHADTPIPYVVGHATDDQVLDRAGLERAKGIVVVLPDDRDNLFVTFTARQNNPTMRIVTRASEAQFQERMKRAGADAVVSPSRIGGMRIASEMIRPQVVSFLDEMLRSTDKTWRIEEISVEKGCALIGKPLQETRFSNQEDLLVLAIRKPKDENFIYNPKSDLILEENSTLVVLGPVESVQRIRQQMMT